MDEDTQMGKPPESLTRDALNVVRGMLMGGADAIPGVSGGTVALILHIYERLVTAISRFDLQLLAHLRRMQWKKVIQHADLRFLVALGCGIVVGLVITLRTVGHLLEDDVSRKFTLAAFFGMILASCVLVARMVKARGGAAIANAVALAALGAALAFSVYWFTTFGHPSATAGAPSYVYLFFCGAIAICAMILPGISGAMILLLLGVYVHLSDVPDHLLAGKMIGASIATVVVFCAGCATGLISFSKILRVLLKRYPGATMAVMCGFMVGALPKLWPFDQELPGHGHLYRPRMPSQLDASVIGVVAIMVTAMVVVFVIDRVARGKKTAIEE